MSIYYHKAMTYAMNNYIFSFKNVQIITRHPVKTLHRIKSLKNTIKLLFWANILPQFKCEIQFS